jgi:hypothetical protein
MVRGFWFVILGSLSRDFYIVNTGL